MRAVAKEGGIQQLISMATSEHVIMQNEALVALAIASALDIGKLFQNFPVMGVQGFSLTEYLDE